MVATEALDKQGNMSLIKISFISLLIKRLSLVIECLCLWAFPCILVLTIFFSSPSIANDKRKLFYLFELYS